MRKTNEERVRPQGGSRTGGCGQSGGEGFQPTPPLSLPRKGYVVWLHIHNQFLGYAWDEERREIRRAIVVDPHHAIYFATFAEAIVATEPLNDPFHILHSSKADDRPKLVR